MFSEDDVKFLQGYATILSFAIDQARLVDLNAALAAEKDMLLRELGHRVRNNNQQLMSLINQQLGWHDHGNDGPDNFVFFDVLDIPLLTSLATATCSDCLACCSAASTARWANSSSGWAQPFRR